MEVANSVTLPHFYLQVYIYSSRARDDWHLLALFSQTMVSDRVASRTYFYTPMLIIALYIICVACFRSRELRCRTRICTCHCHSLTRTNSYKTSYNMSHNSAKELSTSISNEDLEASDLHIEDRWNLRRLQNLSARSLPCGTLRESGVLKCMPIYGNSSSLPRFRRP